MGDIIEIEDTYKVVINRSRWNVRITVSTGTGDRTYVASADSGLTYGDGIYFSSLEEYLEDQQK